MMLALGTNRNEIIHIGDAVEIHEVNGLPEIHVGPDIVIRVNPRKRQVAIAAPKAVEIFRRQKEALRD